MPQVISSSMIVATLAMQCIKQALSPDCPQEAVGYTVNDVCMSEEVFERFTVKSSERCAYSHLHKQHGRIKTVTVGKKTGLKTLYRLIKEAFGDVDECEYEIDIPASALTVVKYRVTNPIHSIFADAECSGRIIDIIGDEYFPDDHIYAVRKGELVRPLRIKIR